jgi:GTP-binding protein
MSQGSNFVDYVKICCRSGHGGAGSAHLHRDKHTAMGGPDGGDGGRGGHVIVKGNAQLWTLLHLKFRKHVISGDGESGGSSQKSGKTGRDEILEVPLGTIAKNAETDEIFFEITEDGETRILTEGGRGGLGNWHFKTATFQTPRFSQPGEDGQEQWNVLELKLLADVGLVGFPNAGKSTLLSVVSAAKPEIADYAFTTLVPNLGIVAYRNNRSFVMADIPGIIEGASQGKGLGFRFLRHIERNSVLLFMVPADTNRTIKEEYDILLHELQEYNPELIHKPRVLAITKSDMLDDELMQEMKKELPADVPSVFISAVAQKNINELKDLLWTEINKEA